VIKEPVMVYRICDEIMCLGEYRLQITRWYPGGKGVDECVARCGGLLTTEGTTGLLLVGGTDSSATTHRLKTSKHFEHRALGECIVRLH